MVTLHRLVAPLEEDKDIRGTTIASATRTIQLAMAIPRASSPRVATWNKSCNNPLAHLATGAMQGLKAKLHPRPASKTLPRSILGRRSMMAATRGASSRHGEGTVPTGTHHDFSRVKHEMNETLRSYTRCFFEMRATMANTTDEDVIRCFQNGLFSKHRYHNFRRNCPTAIVELRDMMALRAD
ncbi:hypothetical protein C2845_PM02G16510 [Panicum miliaceum]|uniref:Uncharacterized protein n=1 Tax=Panicum miliaceum TaxID=4540 RepID=A0A3L6S758_PANMI|nr:hypothetical protein C2845_PM02G16510 [Panicum miliaceum]